MNRSSAPPAPRRARANPLAGLGAALWLLVVAVPLYAMLVATLRSRPEYAQANPLTPPTRPTVDNYVRAIENGFLGFVLNTVLITAGVVVLVVFLSATVGYALVRSRTRFSSGVFRLFLLGLAIPAQAVIIPVLLIINQLGLNDTLLAVILPTAAFALPVCVLILTGSMRDISEELYEAMALDGAGQLRAFVQLVLPLSRSGLATVAVYAALQAWNGFLFPLILITSPEKRPITLGLYEFQGQYGTDIPGLLSAVVLSAIPILLLYLVARRSLVNGLMGVGGK
ncbi:carbohydrate ABC transporter permease [Nocardiopsis ansamitocini]|uniref:ABC transporter permease n=1 Tax=Nocardiopsis ansamitocini TaxID=1670832 RepID=A0A9W6P7T1_9ACTN|nr:carbohydrate ABC transporter permease [Nocardiopsis ansamitocini]GLU48592.1 ABC transporter permease [Nocardiopsis ansamitocini]